MEQRQPRFRNRKAPISPYTDEQYNDGFTQNNGKADKAQHTKSHLSKNVIIIPLVICLGIVILITPLDIGVHQDLSHYNPLLPYVRKLLSAENGPPSVKLPSMKVHKEITARKKAAKVKCSAPTSDVHGVTNTIYCFFTEKNVENKEKYTRTSVYYSKQGKTDEPSRAIWLHGWYYTPVSSDGKQDMGSKPLIIMAHGLGAQKDIVLDDYAAGLVSSGNVRVFAFDYRTWGGSGGYPRHLVVPSYMVDDYLTTIEMLKNTERPEGIDAVEKVFLWGTSFSGGHVLKTYEQLKNSKYIDHSVVKGIVSMEPFLDGKISLVDSFKRRSLTESLRMMASIIPDLVRQTIFNGTPSPVISPLPCSERDLGSIESFFCGSVYMKIAAPPGTTQPVIMSLSKTDYEKWSSKLPEGASEAKLLGGWSNAMVASTPTFLSTYQPINSVSAIDVPIYIIAVTDDELIPIEQVREMKRNNPKYIELFEFPETGHFDIYREPLSSDIVSKTLAFVKRHVE